MLNDFSLFLHIVCNNVCVKVVRCSARTQIDKIFTIDPEPRRF